MFLRPRRLLIITTVFLALFLVSCSFEPKPQEAVSQGFRKALDAKKSSVELTLEGKGFSGGGENGRIAFQLTGKSDSSNSDEPKFDGKASASFGDGARAIDLILDVRLIGKEVYIKLADIKLPSESTIPADGLAVLTGKWWVLPSDSETFSYVRNLTEEQKKFVDELKEAELFASVLKISEENVREMESRKYQVGLNSEGLLQAILTIAKLSGNDIPETEQKALAESLKTIQFDGHVWVAKRGGYANRIAGDIILPKDDSVEQGEKGQGERNLTLSIDFQTWDLGKSFTVEKPSDATPFNPALLFGLMGAGKTDAITPLAPPGTPIDQPLGKEQVKE